MRLPPEVAGFDSASAMAVALARFLHGRDTPPLGKPAARALLPVARAASRLPVRAREAIYSVASGAEAQPAGRIAALDLDDVAAAIVRLYPGRRYPAVMLGSSSGALVHLCAALGVPWLPQTLLLPVRQRQVPVDDPARAVHAFDATARALLAGNPDVVLHHMHDPNQDRLTLRRGAYFRVKRTRLGPAYEEFLTRTLPPGGVLWLAECGKHWPTTRIGERHVFQFGAVGGMQPQEYHDSSARVADYLRRYRVATTRWQAPAPDGESPEAEWGFQPALRDDVIAFARRHGYQIRRLIFDDPQDLSPLVADLYRWWYRQRGLPADRLLVESFILLEPWWALRTGCVPYWTTFPVQPSADTLAHYLQRSDPYDFLHLMLFCHGVRSVGLAPIEQWRAVLDQVRVAGSFAGVAPQRYPSDLATFFAYQRALRAIPTRYPIPEPLPLGMFDSFLDHHRDRYRDLGRDRGLTPSRDATVRSNGRPARTPRTCSAGNVVAEAWHRQARLVTRRGWKLARSAGGVPVTDSMRRAATSRSLMLRFWDVRRRTSKACSAVSRFCDIRTPMAWSMIDRLARAVRRSWLSSAWSAIRWATATAPAAVAAKTRARCCAAVSNTSG